MSVISANYLASVFDHTQIIICVRHASNANEETVKKILQKLNLHKKLVINDAGCAINVRFELDVIPVNSSWGSFQAHRQVYGLIYVAEVTSAMEAALVQEKFNKLKEEYGPNLCHSRCLIFGIDTTIRHPHNLDIFQFSSLNAWKSLDQDIKALITSIFYELESKRLRMPDKSRLPLLVAPFESNSDSKSTDSDTKSFRKKCLGRHNKHLADVSLLAGQLADALMYYHSALETLVSVNDTCWVGSALEGLCVVSALVYFPEIIPDLPYQTMVSKKMPQKQLLDPRNLMNNPSSTPSLAELRKLCIPTVDDLVDRYKEAIIHYSRCKSLGIIEMEACIKATKVLTRAKKFLGASEFLQNAIYITLNLPENERVKRYSVLADLYEGIGFHRKASFYKRVAAMQCVAPQLKEPNWALCNKLLMKSLNGYGVDLEDDCSNLEDNKPGWPSVRLRVLHELVFSSEKIGHHTLGNRHAMYLLLQMFSHLSEAEEKDICTALGNFVSRNPSKSIPYDDNILDLPKLSLYALPVVKRISPQPLLSEVKPVKVGQEGYRSESVFIYTPASYRSQRKNHQKIPFKWCANTACTVRILIHNPLAHTSLNVSDISLIVDSSASGLHCQALSVSLPPKSEEEITMIATPLSPGTVRIIGYALRIFAVRSDCCFKNMSHIPANEIDIEVVHELPLLKCIFPKSALSTHTSAQSINVYRGERYSTSYTLCNVSQCNVDDMKNSLEGDQDHKLVMTVKGQEKELPLFPNDKVTLSVEADASKCDHESESARTLTVHYTGSEGEWWRLLSLNLNINVVDCLILLDTHIANDSSDDQMCILNLMIKNKSSSAIVLSNKGVEGKEINSVALDPNSEKSYSVALHKIPFPSGSGDNIILEDYCLKKLENSIALIWEIESETKNYRRWGYVHLGSILPRPSFCNFLQGLLVCAAEFGGESPTSKSKKTTVGSMCEVVFSFRNVFALDTKLEVDLDIFQDQENGYVERELDECIVCVGRRRQKFQLDPFASKNYECQLLLLRSGMFSIRASYLLHLTPGLLFKYSTPMRMIQYYSSALTVEVN